MAHLFTTRSFKNGESVLEAAKRLEITPEEVLGYVEYLSSYENANISICEENDEYYIRKVKRSSLTKVVKLDIDSLIKTELLVYSDTHFCNKNQQLWMVN